MAKCRIIKWAVLLHKPFPQRLWFFAFCRIRVMATSRRFFNSGVLCTGMCCSSGFHTHSPPAPLPPPPPCTGNFRQLTAVFILIFYFVCRNQYHWTLIASWPSIIVQKIACIFYLPFQEQVERVRAAQP